MQRRDLPGFLLLLALLACGGGDPLPAADTTSLRETRGGSLVGFENAAGGHSWLGVPFAKPPVGELRWRAPRPPEPWEGTRAALTPGAPCAQFPPELGESEEVYGSEDCLTLDIYAPKLAPADVPSGVLSLPVMVWIHGGGNSQGQKDHYDGSRLAADRNVIVVAIQYRLGVFGWFRHPSLYGEGDSALDRSGNYGTLDAIRALEWVHDEIAAFGGDPTRVTIFGESAGGANVFALLRSPRAKGLFHRAIAQSGSARSKTVAQAENYADAPERGDLNSSSEVIARFIARRDGVDATEARRTIDAMPLEELGQSLRDAGSDEILTLFRSNGVGPLYDGPRLIADGAVLSALPALDAYEQGDYNRVPVILGSNRDEQRTFALMGSPFMRRVFGVPLGLKDERMYLTVSDFQSRAWKARGVDEPARRMRRVQGSSVYAYRFDWDAEPGFLWLDIATWLGAGHAVEIPFVLGTLSLGPATALVFDPDREELDRQLSDRMTSYWTQFAYTGDPGRGRDGDLPEWEPWAADGGSFLVLDAEDDGGLRMSGDTVTKASVVADVATDPRLESQLERCHVYRALADRERTLSVEAFAQLEGGACTQLVQAPRREGELDSR